MKDDAITHTQNTSKYIKPTKELEIFERVAVCFFFSLFVLPQYFGIPTPVFDFTILRIMILVVLFMIIVDKNRFNNFVELVFTSRFTKFLLPYLFVICYTMVLRVDINALLNPLMEIISFYLLVYVVNSSLGVEKTIRLIISFTYLLTILGVVEYVIGVSPFSYLNTLPGIYTGRFVRSGHYRIMSSCVHSLGYGLLLMTVTPFACIDIKNNKISFFANLPLLLLLGLNVFLTGSRSTLAVFLIELFIVFLIVNKEEKRKIMTIGIVAIVVFAISLIVFKNTDIGQYMLLQITTIVDTVFGTEFSSAYGANVSDLSSSSNYREQLKYIFTVDWLNPLLGIGRKRSFSAEINGSYIKSVDNFYIAEYIRYAYPGLLMYLLFIGYFVINLYKKMKKEDVAVYKILFVGCVGYLINLLWVDSLQTLKYLYILFAIFWVMEIKSQNKCLHKEEIKVKSKYIREKN